MPETALEEVVEHLERCPGCESAARALDDASDPFLAAVRRSAGAGTLGAEEPIPERVGEYTIVEELGRGGMGVVYRARHDRLGRVVALKMVLGDAYTTRDQRQRFRAEASAAARLRHPHIVEVYEIGEVEVPAGPPRPYFTLEFVDGGNLAARLAGRPQPPRQAAAWLEPLARAAHYAHQNGIVHRDLKPSNVLLTADGQPKLCDFGVAKVLGNPGVKTLSGMLVGTADYMAPEQAEGKAVGPATDVHALGAILYTMLTGRPPFQGASTLDTLDQVRTKEPVPPRRLQPQVPADLETICLKCLQKEPHQRYASAESLADDLRRFLNNGPIRARPVGLLARAWRWGRRHPREAVLGGALAALLVLAAGTWAWMSRQRADRAAAAAVAVAEALEEAKHLQGQARASAEGDLAAWSEALSAAKRAEALLAQAEAEEKLRRRVQATLTELQEEEHAARGRAERAAKDRRMAVLLEEIRMERAALMDTMPDALRSGERYASAFREYGIDVLQGEPEEVAAQIRGSAIRQPLCTTLDVWAWQEKDQARAERLWAVVRAADPDPWRDHFRTALMPGNPKALKELATSPEVRDLPPVSLTLYGLALALSDCLPEAVALLLEAQHRYPGDFWINHELALYLALSKPPRLDEAIQYFSIAVALRSQHPGEYRNLGTAWLRKGNLKEAANAFGQAVRLRPDLADLHNDLSGVCFLQKDFEGAIKSAGEAIRLDPRHVKAHGNLGTALFAKGNLEAAADCFREVIRLQSDNARAYYDLGNVLDILGDPGEAIACFRKATQLEPNEPRPYSRLGLALSRRGLLEEAAAAYEDAVRFDPDGADAHLNLGQVRRHLGQFREAREALQKGQALMAKRSQGPNPAERWLRETDRYIELEKKLPDILAGKLSPSGTGEQLEFANLCLYKSYFVASARFYQALFAAQPRLESQGPLGQRFRAARVAAFAAGGQGRDAPGTVAGRTQWGKQALAWLRPDLDAVTRLVASDAPGARRRVRAMLRDWRQDPAFAGVRDAKALADLAEDVCRDWQRFWADLDGLLTRISR